MTVPDPEPRAPEGIEQRLRRGILLVAAAAVLMTAVPLLILSIASGVGLEQRKSGFVAELIERTLRQRIHGFREEITGLAAAPILATGLTDSAGRQAYLAPFLKQRADATQSRLTLFDYRGRPLLDTAEDSSVRPADNTRLPAEAVSLLRGDRLAVTAPIRFFANQRLIGGLEGQLPLRTLIAEATRGLVDEYHVVVLQGELVVFATAGAPGPGDAAGMVTLKLDLPGEGSPMRIELRSRLGWFAPYFWRISLVMLCAVLAALLLALLAARRIARVLTAPISALARASDRFRAGEVPDLGGLQPVREIATLGEALAGAFRARDAAQAEAVRYTERMLEGLPVAVFHAQVDATGGFTLDYLSAGIARIAGWPPEALRDAAGWAACLGPGAPTGFLRTAFREGEGLAEFPVTRPDGRRIWLRERSRVIGRSEREVEVVGTLTDITVERALQAQAVSAGKLALLGEMATGLAHELSQPLAVMSLAAENAARSVRKQGGASADSVLGRLDRIIGQAARARGIVDHLRVFARRDEVVALEPVSLARALGGR